MSEHAKEPWIVERPTLGAPNISIVCPGDFLIEQGDEIVVVNQKAFHEDYEEDK